MANVFEEMRDRLRRLAQWQRPDEDAQRELDRLSAEAARLVKAAEDHGAIDLGVEGWKWPDPVPAGFLPDDGLWLLCWRMICSIAAIADDGVPSNVGAARMGLVSEGDGIRLLAGRYDPKDWRERAEDYACVCDWLAKESQPDLGGVKPKRRRSRLIKIRPLTDLQAEAFDAVTQCDGNISMAARRLGKSEGTVRQHYKTAMDKLNFQGIKPTKQAMPTDKRGQTVVSKDRRKDLR